MYFLPWRLADALNRGTLGERANGLYLLAFLIWPFPLLRVRVSADEWPVAAALALIVIVGLGSVFRANGGSLGRRLIERYVCLHTPIAIGSWILGSTLGGLFVSALGSSRAMLDAMTVHSMNMLATLPWMLIVVTYFVGMQHFVRRAARSSERSPGRSRTT